ncbi:unnamed protein product, partial [Rotaria sp. Silwood1]
SSVLDDPSLVEELNVNKRIAKDLKKKITVDEDTKIKISTTREGHRIVAIQAHIIYFLLSEIALINHMHQRSLQQYLGVFQNSMNKVFHFYF